MTTARPLRVGTYNLHDLTDDRDALAHVVRSLRADVLCLQEVPRRLGARRRLGRLAREVGLVVAASGRGSGGTAVLVARQVQVVDGAVHRLPVPHWWTRRRGVAVARLRLPDGSALTAASVHLPLTPALRLRHALTVLVRLQGGREGVLVGGDLNEERAGSAWTALAAALTGPVDGGDLRTFPARAPRRQIDALLVGSGVRLTGLRVAGAADGLDAATLAAASDHLPLVADLALDA